MKIRPDWMKAFALRIGGRLTVLWAKRAASIASKLAAAVADEKWAEAYAIIDAIKLDDLCEDAVVNASGVLPECVQLGAAMQTQHRKTGYMTGKVPWPDPLMNSALAAYFNNVRGDGAEIIREKLRAEIAQLEDAVKQAQLTISKADIDQGLADALNRVVLQGGRSVINIGANLVTTRLVAFGAVSELAATGATSYKWTSILDGSECALCRTSHGKKFETARAVSRLEGLLQMTDPGDLKANAPWPKDTPEGRAQFAQLTIDELTARGWNVPPLHPHCRCQLVRVDNPLAAPWDIAQSAYAYMFGPDSPVDVPDIEAA
jgi:hypothetical protein